MIKNKLALLVFVTAVLGANALVFGSIGAEGKPKRVLIVLFDQMRPEYADRFNMTNFKKLRGEGTNFDKAYLGYMGSETVISHNVIVSGQLPKHQGWVDEGYRDATNLLNKGFNAMHITGDFSLANFQTLVGNAGYPKLSDYLHAAFPGTKFITVGEKSYAVESAAATGTPLAGDIAVRMSSRKSVAACVATLGGQYRQPQGLNVPSYLLLTDPTDPLSVCGRFYVNADKGNDYGTKASFPSFMYPEEGNRFVPGTDAAHLGGDTWVADAAMKMMEMEPNWSGMFVTLGAIDKTGHMFGADQDTDGHDCSVGTGQVHGDCAAKNADDQLGRILDKLKELRQLDDTLVVLTADHGATHGASFYGKPTLLAGDSNWYYDATGNVFDGGGQYDPLGGPASVPANPNPYHSPSAEIAKLDAALNGNLQFSYQSTSIQAWLTNHDDAHKLAAIGPMSKTAGVIATYWRDGDRYVLANTNPMTKSEEKWWKLNGQSIIDGMAADNGPDVVGLLHDDTSYGVYGDHGGATKEVQRVPMVFWSSSDKYGTKVDDPFQTADLMPTILRAMRIPLTHSVDGKSHELD